MQAGRMQGLPEHQHVAGLVVSAGARDHEDQRRFAILKEGRILKAVVVPKPFRCFNALEHPEGSPIDPGVRREPGLKLRRRAQHRSGPGIVEGVIIG